MSVRVSESIVLRSYPFREADSIVSFFTRDGGKLRGVARRARRPNKNFGSGLERLSHVAVSYYQRENRELVNLNSCELIHSPFSGAPDFETSVAMDYLAEISEQMLPPEEVNERQFRLLLAVLEGLRGGTSVWAAATYYSLWTVRLAGFLPPVRVSGETRKIAEEMLATPVAALAPRAWTRETAADLRRALARLIEEHIERKLLTAPIFEAL